MIHGILGIWNYWIVIILMMTGLFIVISRHNLVKKMVDSDLDLANREKVLIDNNLMKPTWEYST